MLPSVGKSISVHSNSAEDTFLTKVKADDIHAGKQKVSQYNCKVVKKLVDAAVAHPQYAEAIDNKEMQRQRDEQRQHLLVNLKQDSGYVTI